MSSATLQEIRDRAREISDYQNSEFVTDTELDKIINEGYAEFYDWVIDTYEDFYLTGPLAVQISSGNTINLDGEIANQGFYKLKGLDYQISGDDWVTLTKFNWRERNSSRFDSPTRGASGQFNRAYRIIDRVIYIIPEDQATGVYRLWYIPLFEKLTLPTSTFRGENGWEKYVMLYAAKFIKLKAEEDVSDINREMAIVKERIERLGANRDIEGVQTVSKQDDFYDGYHSDYFGF